MEYLLSRLLSKFFIISSVDQDGISAELTGVLF